MRMKCTAKPGNPPGRSSSKRRSHTTTPSANGSASSCAYSATETRVWGANPRSVGMNNPPRDRLPVR